MIRFDVPSKTTFSAEFYGPSAPSAAGLLVLVYGTDGFVDNERGPWRTMVRGYAEDLASRGVCARIPDYFRSTGTQHDGPAAFEIGSKRGEWAAALVDTVSHARTLAGVDPARVGMLGSSLGGYVALLTRAAVKPRALVEHFAPRFDGIGAAGCVPSAQIHHGTNDHGPEMPAFFGPVTTGEGPSGSPRRHSRLHGVRPDQFEAAHQRYRRGIR